MRNNSYANFLLLGLHHNFQHQGFGSLFISECKRRLPKISLWADYNAVTFYLKHLFRIIMMKRSPIIYKIWRFSELMIGLSHDDQLLFKMRIDQGKENDYLLNKNIPSEESVLK